MKDVIFGAITFVENGDVLHGYYFYNEPTDTDYGHINGINQLTLPKAIKKMGEKGIDVFKNIKINIKVYYLRGT